MTYEKAIQIIGQAEFRTNHDADYAVDVVDAITLAIQSLEKQIEKKPIHINYDDCWHIVYWNCPNCGVQQDRVDDYCCNCGQAIDWSEE